MMAQTPRRQYGYGVSALWSMFTSAHGGTTPPPRQDAAHASALPDTEVAVASSPLTEGMAASVDQPLMLLQPHHGLMSGDNSACSTRLDVTKKLNPLRFTEGMGRVDIFATTKRACIPLSATASIELVQSPRDGADASAPNRDMVLVRFGAYSLPAHSGTTPPPRRDAAEASALPDTEMAVASSLLTKATATSVDQPLMLLQPHPGLMSGDDSACAIRLDVTE
jgi:hypothetical protein